MRGCFARCITRPVRVRGDSLGAVQCCNCGAKAGGSLPSTTSSAKTSLGQWLVKEKEVWDAAQAQRMQAFSQSLHDERALWQSQLLEKNSKFAEGLSASVAELKSEVDARWKVRVAENAAWQVL